MDNSAHRQAAQSWDAMLPTDPIDFAPAFKWGVASSAFQAEGGDVCNDWVMEAALSRLPSNPGNGFRERAEEDFGLIAGLSFGHYRLSVEWSRVEPDPGQFDQHAIDGYKQMCESAMAAGLTPWVNFLHFTMPSWVARTNRFLNDDNVSAFLRYLERVGSELAPYAQHFHVGNELLSYVTDSYRRGLLPPYGQDEADAVKVMYAVLFIYAHGYLALKGINDGCEVATIEAYQECRAGEPEDEALAMAEDSWLNKPLLTGLRSGWVELPGQREFEIPELKGAADLYGFNYYASTTFVRGQARSTRAAADAPHDAMGRFVFPWGLEDGLCRVHNELPNMRLIVAENGCPTIDECFRIRYIAAHLAAIDRAAGKGARAEGYFHWTAVDNFEWREGFSDARFGLIGFDPKTKDRYVKQSGDWISDIIKKGRLTREDIP